MFRDLAHLDLTDRLCPWRENTSYIIEHGDPWGLAR